MEMPGYDAATYGERFADIYDDWYGDLTDTDECVAAIVELAPAHVLELGVGTGRLAIPLAAAGCQVTGLDSSPAMLERLAAKADAAGVTVTGVLGDMATVPVPDGQRFDVVLVAYNTFFNLATAGEQEHCMGRVAGLLGAGGRLLIETFVPNENPGAPSATVEPRSIAADRVVLSVSQHHPEGQDLLGQFIEITEAGGVRLRPWRIHYSTVAQLDEMAQRAGLVLVERWADWDRSAFGPDSPKQISVFCVR